MCVWGSAGFGHCSALPPSWAAVWPLVAWQPPFVIFSPVTSIERALQKSNSRSISASNRAVSPELAVHPAVLFVMDWSEGELLSAFSKSAQDF